MRPVVRASLMLLALLAIPIIPFLILGESFEQQVTAWLADKSEAATHAQGAVVVGLLTSDIFLPIPSSMIITMAGGRIGFGLSSLYSWLGMTTGSVVGFGFAKWCGPAFAKRFAEPEDLERIEHVSQRLGPYVLIVTRPLPILAEACVLMMGTTKLSWRRFLLPVAAMNLVVAMFYASFGVGREDQSDLVLVSIVSGTVPLLLALWIRRRLSNRIRESSVDDGSPKAG